MSAALVTDLAPSEPPREKTSRLSRAQELRAFHRLSAWLGPWRDKTECPPHVSVHDAVLDAGLRGARPVRARIYAPTDHRPIGSYLFAHGLNQQGPSDPRCDRFARVLAHAGFVVVCPELPEYVDLLVEPSVAQPFEHAARAFLSLDQGAPWGRPGVFGVSFGSFPALVTAGHPELSDAFGGVVIFGGYADFHRTLRFALGLREGWGKDLHVDLTCLPAVYLNLLPVIAPQLSPQDKAAVASSIRRYVAQTWGKPEMKDSARSLPLAAAIADDLMEVPKAVFRLASGLEPGGVEQCVAGLSSHDERLLDPRPAMAGIRCPVYLMHSADDDVIGCDEVQSLLSALPAAVERRSFLTGLYDHGGQVGGGSVLASGSAMMREALTMAGMVRAIIRGGSDSGP